MVSPPCTLLAGDCRHHLWDMADNSIDSIVTDPPYALVSMVNRFGKTSIDDDTRTSERVRARADGYARLAGAGFMGETWDTGEVAFAADFWAECLRVLKPGGHLLAMGGTRTYHRLACAIEDAGFDIRDQLAWVYGTGFPKSHDVSKGIDKAAGAKRAQQTPKKGTATYGDFDGSAGEITAPATAEAEEWDGWGTALKPSWEPIALARKPLSEKTIAANVLRWGTGALNIDASRVNGADNPHRWVAPRGGIWQPGTGKHDLVASDKGRWPANLLHDGSPEVVGAFPLSNGQWPTADGKHVTLDGGEATAARFFYSAKASKTDRDEGLENLPKQRSGGMSATLDGSMLTGSGNERTTQRANYHPTVKPTALMAWMIQLVTRPGGVVLDPFMGSGSTGKAAIRGGFGFVGVEKEVKYLPIATARIAFEVQKLNKYKDF